MGFSNMPKKKKIMLIVAIVLGILFLSRVIFNSSDSTFLGVIALAGLVLFIYAVTKQKKEDNESRPRELVEETSELLAKVKELGNETNSYYLDVERTFGKDIHCESRASFNNVDYYNCFLDWVNENYENLPDLINKVSHNREIAHKYETDLAKLYYMNLKGWDSSMSIPQERYRDLEKELVKRAEKYYPQEFAIEISKQYTSSAGNVNLYDNKYYNLLELKKAFETIRAYRKPQKEQSDSTRIHRQLQEFFMVNTLIPEREQLYKLLSVSEKEGFLKGDGKSIETFYLRAFDCIKWPVSFEKNTQIEFAPDSKTLFIDFLLPEKKCVPRLKEVKNLQYNGTCDKKYYSESMINEIYDSFIYQLVIVMIEWVFVLSSKMEWHEKLDGVAFNGRVKTIDKSTGREITPYILSVYESRLAFDQLVLDSIDPKAWFKRAKGISAASLADVTPISPSFSLRKDDKRFVDGYSVIDEIDNSMNLAAMDWQDFENLIREVFEQEFAANGGEVKITQASRDGGVDAIAFDPDPIRGGKIVIQAKRYTNVVGVAAVRDLYGTVINEGASKGILVTTAYYGTDAYKFAQGKPITLLDGSNLLSLLEKHGRHARINIQEAKKAMEK